ncbi:MAG: hypothetical protein IKF31_01030 [Clostridiales bacterium]|nr:hypothetical protein [Clostridiales bacterium]
MYLYHYFDKRTGPFMSLTMLPDDQAIEVLEKVKAERPDSFCAQRNETYITKRKNCEALLRREFIAKGGIVEILSPYYLVVEHSPWLYTWYEQPDMLKIPVEEFDVRTLSFTYGDSMPTFAVKDGKEYRQQVYTYDEVLNIIHKYGLPQDWNNDGSHGPERYIEVHVWSDKTIKNYL